MIFLKAEKCKFGILHCKVEIPRANSENKILEGDINFNTGGSKY